MSKAHRATRSPLFLQVLEPRVLLDAAAAQTALDVAQQSDAAPSPPDAPRDHADLVAALSTLDGDNPPADAASARDDSRPPPAPAAVYFIDRGVADPDLLARSLPPGAEIYFIEAGTDGVAFIAQTLDGRSEVGAIHILSHGDAGALQLGNVALTLENMQGTFRDELQAIGSALSADADKGGSVQTTVAFDANGTVTYTPNPNFTGSDSFSYTVASGGVSETATVTVKVNASNDVPTPVDPGVPGQTFDPSGGNYAAQTQEDTAFNGRVAATDVEGNALTYTIASFTYTVASGGVTETATVMVNVASSESGVQRFDPATLASATSRQDYPLVFRPVEARDETSAPQAESRTIDARPVVLQVVDGFGSLRGTGALDQAQGVVLQAVNGVDSLNALASFGARGIVLDAVGAIEPLGSIDSPKTPGRAGPWQGPARASIVDRPMVPSLVLADQRMRLEMETKNAQVWLFVSAPEEVRGLRATLANGRPLPGWARLAPGGALVMDRPADVDRMRLRIGLELEDGKFRSREVDIDFNAGQLRTIDPSGNRPGPADAERGDPARERGRALTFAEQLSKATVPSDADAQLLELLN